MAIDYLSIGARIRYYRLQKELSQQDLADQVGVSKSLIGYIERGDKAPGLDTLVNIANTLTVPADELRPRRIGVDDGIPFFGIHNICKSHSLSFQRKMGKRQKSFPHHYSFSKK